MNVLHINTYDIEGGAARAAYRLHMALSKQGINSQMLSLFKNSDDSKVISSNIRFKKSRNKTRSIIDLLPSYKYKNRTRTLFSTSWLPSSQNVKLINKIKPDIVHFHWINKGLISIEDISKIEPPVVWSLHDMWAFTGGCHYDENCGAFVESCGNCKVLQSAKDKDLSRRVYNRKKKSYRKKQDITVIGLSNWLALEARRSSLLSQYTVENLPNTIDTSIFAPFNKSQARELLNLPESRKMILFGAMDATSDPRKGFKELVEALARIKSSDVELVIFGSSYSEDIKKLSYKTHFLGRVYDDVTLRLIYNACDVLLMPSIQENLSNVIMESLSCGTPVIGFDIGGNSDLIEHKGNGYLVKPFDTLDFSNGIDWLLNSNKKEQMSKSARNKVCEFFDYDVVAKQYIKLYENIINE